MRSIVPAVALCVAIATSADSSIPPTLQSAPLGVIPAPASTLAGTGTWVPAAPITVSYERDDAELRALADVAAGIVAAGTGLSARLAQPGAAPVPGGVVLRVHGDTLRTPREGYRLTVAPTGVEISAATGAGVFYALQTLRQLVDGSGGRVAATTIEDAPRFQWRGLHLDVARHFFPVEFVKKYIDVMARYKFNTFHWHLTEDQGWRIEIAKYPLLTSVGGCRRETMVGRNFNLGDGIRYCGFYTQAEIRDVVEYARERYVTIVPEIEMPGHAKAALAAYPELACTPGPFEVRTTWGVDEDVFCPSERTFEFIEDVLTEVLALFPGRYIHIGGDEVPKTRWRQSALAQEVMRREGLRNEEELQSWFIRRVERFLIANGRRLVGWDEILEGGLAPQATVMSWRGTAGGIAAAREGHDVVMTPNSHLYFDHYQGDARFEPLAIGGMSPLERVYAYEPVPDVLSAGQARHILGAQANLWSEYLKTPQAVEYMAYPRALALAEVVWSPRAARDWQSFTARLPVALRSLAALGVNYRVAHVDGLESDRLTLDPQVTISLRTLEPGAAIRYTTDGSDATSASPLYERPFTLPVGASGVRVTARAFARDGRASAPRAATFTRTTHRAATPPPAAGLASGLRYEFYQVSVRNTRGIDTLRATREGTIAGVALRGDERAERYALRLSGYIRVLQDGLYEFALGSDDGSTLTIGDRLVVDNDGAHGMEEKFGMIALRAGLHPLVVRYFQGGGGAGLTLAYRLGAGAWTPVPAEWFVRGAGAQ
jgi:hexosaminidase